MTILSEETNLVFEETTNRDIIKYTHLQNGSVWKGELSLEEYAQREAILGSSEIGQKQKSMEMKEMFPNGHEFLGIKYFTFKDLRVDSQDKTDQIVSSCEILNRLGYCIRGSHGSIEPCLVATIGGVYTMPKHRGKGYAKKMIHSLNDYLDTIRDAPNAPRLLKNMIVILYSEVGEYYAKLGYKSEHVPLHIITQLDEMKNRYCYDNVEGRQLGFDGYQDLVALQWKAFEKNLHKLHKKNPDNFVFTVYPDIDLYKWFAHRDIFIMEKTNRVQKDLKFGFALPDNSHIIWHHNWSANSLVVVKLFIEEENSDAHETIRKLMTEAVNEAKKTGLSSLLFWDQEIELEKVPLLKKLLLEMEHDSNVYVKNSSLSAFRAPKGFNNDEVIWDNNTKFCWF